LPPTSDDRRISMLFRATDAARAGVCCCNLGVGSCALHVHLPASRVLSRLLLIPYELLDCGTLWQLEQSEQRDVSVGNYDVGERKKW